MEWINIDIKTYLGNEFPPWICHILFSLKTQDNVFVHQGIKNFEAITFIKGQTMLAFYFVFLSQVLYLWLSGFSPITFKLCSYFLPVYFQLWLGSLTISLSVFPYLYYFFSLSSSLCSLLFLVLSFGCLFNHSAPHPFPLILHSPFAYSFISMYIPDSDFSSSSYQSVPISSHWSLFLCFAL